MHDYLVVGAGIWGATFAREMLDRGRSVLVIDRRPHVAGNCYTEDRAGIEVHCYGAHIFHTRSRRIWDHVQRFADWLPYRHIVKARIGDAIYPMPPGLGMLQQLYGVTTPAEARSLLYRVRVPCDRPTNLRDYVRDALGDDVYRLFYEGYSRKQWGRDPSEIPVAIGKRLPIRLAWDDSYFPGEYQGIPADGYTAMIARMLDGAAIELGVDFLSDRDGLSRLARRVVYTGPIDAFFGHEFGPLEYRSLRFEEEVRDGDFQGAAVVNYPDASIPWTRIIEHRHFRPGPGTRTVVTREFPIACGPGDTPYYPVETEENRARLARYQAMARGSVTIFGGRLAEYRYYDMDQAIGSALAAAGRVASAA